MSESARMRLDAQECQRRLAGADHGILATRSAERGVDAVPVCFALVGHPIGHQVVVPIDRVKPKTTTGLRRTANLDADARAVLVVEAWDPDDWSRLWWVQAHLERVATLDADDPDDDDYLDALRQRYAQYRVEGAIASVLVFSVARLSGWAGADSPP